MRSPASTNRHRSAIPAALKAGISNIVAASGETVLGLPFDTPPPYIPVDEEYYAASPAFDADARQRTWNLWGCVDGRDGAEAVRLALEHPATGFDRFIVAAADTVMSRDSTELVAEVFPDVPVHGDISGHGTLISFEKARSVLG